MNEIERLIQDILSKGYLMSLATVDESGPWVSDVVYIEDGFNLYWISDISTRHSQAVLKNSKVAATITLSNNQGEDNIGLQIEGKAEKVEGELLEITAKHRLKRKKPVTQTLEKLDPKKSWYKLTPTKIELIYEPKWGFKKQIIRLS